jgi:hypothetical protein
MITSSHTNSLNVPQSRGELSNIALWGQRDKLLIEHGSIIIHTEYLHTIGKWSDVKLFEELGLWSTYFVTYTEDNLFGSDLDLSFHDFSGDFECMEELDVLWGDTGWSFGDKNVDGRDGSDFGFAWNG